MSLCAEDWVREEEEMVSGCETSEDLNLHQVDVVCSFTVDFFQTKIKAAKRNFLFVLFLALPQDKSGMTTTSSCVKISISLHYI